MRRVGVMGGTFDPVHHGHLVAASEVAHRFRLDEVVFVPTGQPWQKRDRPVTPAEDRYLMTVIATAADPRFRVSRVDVDRDGPTYTVDTLRDLKAEYAADGVEAELFFITAPTRWPRSPAGTTRPTCSSSRTSSGSRVRVTRSPRPGCPRTR